MCSRCGTTPDSALRSVITLNSANPAIEGTPTYYGPNWREQRRRARRRDGFSCRRCGITKEEHQEAYNRTLHVHHITPFRSFVDGEDADYQRANRLDNLLTLCIPCHKRLEGVPVPIDAPDL